MEHVGSQPENSTDIHAPAGSATVRKGEPSATELAMLQVNLTSDEDDRLDEVLEDSLRRYAQLAASGQAGIDQHINSVTEVMRNNGWDTPVSEDHRSWEDSSDTTDDVPRPLPQAPEKRRLRWWRHNLHLGRVGTV